MYPQCISRASTISRALRLHYCLITFYYILHHNALPCVIACIHTKGCRRDEWASVLTMSHDDCYRWQPFLSSLLMLKHDGDMAPTRTHGGRDTWGGGCRNLVSPVLADNPPRPLRRATPVSEQQQVFFPQFLESCPVLPFMNATLCQSNSRRCFREITSKRGC